MAKEVLAVPEEFLPEVIHVILVGLNEVTVSEDVYQNLTKWCNDELDYLDRLKGKK